MKVEINAEQWLHFSQTNQPVKLVPWELFCIHCDKVSITKILVLAQWMGVVLLLVVLVFKSKLE